MWSMRKVTRFAPPGHLFFLLYLLETPKHYFIMKFHPTADGDLMEAALQNSLPYSLRQDLPLVSNSSSRASLVDQQALWVYLSLW